MSRSFDEHGNHIGLYKPHKGKEGIIGKQNKPKRKMKPLLGDKKENYGKYTFADSNDVPHSIKTKSMKLEVKNANRASKKRERFNVKQEIAKQIANIEDYYVWIIDTTKMVIIETTADVPFGGRLISIEASHEKAVKVAEAAAKEYLYSF